MKAKAYIIFDTCSPYLPWQKLYSPNEYQLILIADIDTYAELQNRDLLKYFSKHIKLECLEYGIVKKVVAEVIASLNGNGIVNSEIGIINNDELCSLKAAKLRDEFNVQGPSYAQMLPFRNKLEAKKRLKACEQFLPRYMAFDCKAYKANPKNYVERIIKFLGFPIFAKPIDLVASVGTSKINNEEELKQWCVANQENEHMELDQFIDGVMYECDSLIRDGMIIRTDIAMYLNTCGDFVKGKVLGSIELPQNTNFYKEVCEFNGTILKHLNPPDGCTHLEFFQTRAGKLVFIECAARAPGAKTPEIREISTGMNCILEHYRLRMGLPYTAPSQSPNCFAAWVYLPRLPGVLHECFEPNDLSSQTKITWGNKPGDIMKRTEGQGEICGFIFLNNSNFQVLLDDFKSFNYRTLYTVASSKEDKDEEQIIEAVTQSISAANEVTNQERASSVKLQLILNAIREYYSSYVKPNSQEKNLLFSGKPPVEKLSGYVNTDPENNVHALYRRVYDT